MASRRAAFISNTSLIATFSSSTFYATESNSRQTLYQAVAFQVVSSQQAAKEISDLNKVTVIKQFSSKKNPARHTDRDEWTPDVTYRRYPAIDLSGVCTFLVWVVSRCHLQHAHAECVDVDAFVIMLLIHLWRHELRCACIVATNYH